MSRVQFSRLSHEQKTTTFNSIISIVGVFIASIPISISIWLVNNSLLTRIIAVTIFVFLVIIVTLINFFFYRQLFHKEMTFSVTSHTPIVEMNSSLNPPTTPTIFQSLVVTYNNQVEKSLYLILIDICNTGHTIISEADYDPKSKGIVIRFTPGIRILDANMKKGNETVFLECQKEDIIVPKFESAPGDSVTLRVFLSEDIDTNDVRRIQAQDTYFPIRKVDAENERNKKMLKKIYLAFDVLTAFLFVGSLITWYIVSFALSNINTWVLLLFLSGISIIYLCFMVSRLFNFIIYSRQSKI